jgi:hypothetical protein
VIVTVVVMAAIMTHDGDVHELTSPPAPRQTGPSVWRAADVADPSGWTWQLVGDQIDALVDLARRAPDVDVLAVDTPPPVPPPLADDVEHLRDELLHGRAFRLVRGFPADDVDDSTAATAFVVLGRWLGSPRSQNAVGDLLGHVRDVGVDADDPNVRIYQTNRRQTFHTDSTDVVGLMCLEPAASGGESMLVSAGAIYNEILDRAPELAAVLFHPIATDRRGEVPSGATGWFSIPVLNWHAGHLTVLYQRQYIESAQRFDEVPRLTAEVRAALDLFDEVANDPAMYLTMDFRRGDMQFVHNHSLLHDRAGFTDKPGSPRHLLRLWLSIPGDRELPPVFAERYGSVEIGNRGGIVV